MKKASDKYNLQELNPLLSKEWHPTKNGSLLPSNVTPNSGKRVWWQCRKGHTWRTDICTRNTQKTGCPDCGGKR
ncbi:MAG: zinc-ribbon domain-containing protein, partial [Candidatus Omnitrophota bacterium]